MLYKYNHLLTVLCILLLTPLFVIGQNTNDYYEITILSADTKESLPGATALNLNTGKGESADKNGILRLKKIERINIIEFSYLGYQKKRYKSNELPDIVFLEKDRNLIESVTIISKKTHQALTVKSETIIDFAMEKDKIVMLTKIVGKDYVLKLTNLKGEHIFTQELPKIKQIEELVTSCFGTHFLIAKKEVLQLHVLENEIIIVDRSDRKNFDEFIKPCLAQNENYVYTEKRKLKNQIASIYAFSKKDEETFLFAGVADDENLKRYKYDAPYMNYADGTGPVYLGIHAENARDALQWGDMLNRSFYLPVDFFMMSHRDNILIFDHEKNKLKTFDQKGNLINENDIDYHKQKGWKSKDNLYLDKITNKLFAIHRMNPKMYFTEIDLNSGASIHRYEIIAPFVENLAIHNNIVYYTNSSVTQSSRILNKVKL